LSAEDRFLATPTARGKFDLSESDLIVVDAAGKTRAGGAKIFGEWALHAEIYRSRPDVTAVIHAHPPEASAFGLAGSALPVDFWPEGVVSLGRLVPCIAQNFGNAARAASACLVQGNGVFAWGASVEQAYLRLELVEHLTRIFTLARSAGTLRHLPPDTTALLMDKRKKAGLLSPEESLNGI
jgi:L-fuculose-phosphate aldolase